MPSLCPREGGQINSKEGKGGPGPTKTSVSQPASFEVAVNRQDLEAAFKSSLYALNLASSPGEKIMNISKLSLGRHGSRIRAKLGTMPAIQVRNTAALTKAFVGTEWLPADRM